MMMVVMVVVYYNHDLRLRRIGYCEAEGEHESEQNLFHDLSMLLVKSIYRATMTTPRNPALRRLGE
jgi:hypothetical protein